MNALSCLELYHLSTRLYCEDGIVNIAFYDCLYLPVDVTSSPAPVETTMSSPPAPAGAIAGGVMGVLIAALVVGLIIGVVVCVVHRQQKPVTRSLAGKYVCPCLVRPLPSLVVVCGCYHMASLAVVGRNVL